MVAIINQELIKNSKCKDNKDPKRLCIKNSFIILANIGIWHKISPLKPKLAIVFQMSFKI
jgi:hypothetical protein